MLEWRIEGKKDSGSEQGSRGQGFRAGKNETLKEIGTTVWINLCLSQLRKVSSSLYLNIVLFLGKNSSKTESVLAVVLAVSPSRTEKCYF